MNRRFILNISSSFIKLKSVIYYNINKGMVIGVKVCSKRLLLLYTRVLLLNNKELQYEVLF